MTAKIHWFGDSWCEGWPGGGTPFANLTSDYLDMPFENYGKHSTNIIDMVEMFLEKKENIFVVGCPSLDALFLEKKIESSEILKKFKINGE